MIEQPRHSLRAEVMAAQCRARKFMVWKARMPAPNDDGWQFFTATNAGNAGRRREELGLLGPARRATHAELVTIAVRALDGY